jgi:hypothetical protein
MKRCPTCNRTFTDPGLSFCIDDGTPLAQVPDQTDETTVFSPSSGQNRSQSPAWTTPAYVPPGPAAPTPTRKRKVWPWVVAILGLLLVAVIGFGIVAAVYLPRIMSTRNTSNRNGNSNRRVVIGNENSNANSNANNANGSSQPNANADNGNENLNANSNSDAPPTNHDDVLSLLTDLEHDWTVANLNADKKTLDRILADDYVATVDGRSIGKQEYIRTIERDTQTQDWKFEDLKLDLNGARATLSGTVRFRSKQGSDTSFQFVDKFVWRDGRWQATGSELTPVS